MCALNVLNGHLNFDNKRYFIKDKGTLLKDMPNNYLISFNEID